MARFSPKIEIINHFDIMINQVDIEIEESLVKYKEEQLLGDQERIRNERDFKFPLCFHLCCFASLLKKDNSQSVEVWPKSTKVIDYLNQVRKETIDELRKAQENSISYFNSISSLFKLNDQGKRLDEIKSQLFGENFYFQVRYKPKLEDEEDEWIFNLYTIVTDFYMSSVDINLLENMINAWDNLDLLGSYSGIIFDEKMILIGLIQERFFENMNSTDEPPHHLIRVSKNDLSNIRSITCHYDMSGVNLTYSPIYLPLKLERIVLRAKGEIKIEDFSSLKSLDLKLHGSFEPITIRKLTELQDLQFELVESPINSYIQIELFDKLPSVEKLTLIGQFSDFNLDNLFNLEKLSIKGLLNNDFNFDLFKNLRNQLTYLSIDCSNIDNDSVNKLFIDNNFPNLSKLRIMNTNITKLENKIFSQFQKLNDLKLYDNKELKSINYDCFSNLKQLTRLNLTESLIGSLDKRHFSALNNLEYLKLSLFNIVDIEENIFSNLTKLTNLDLSYCKLENLKPESFIGLINLKILDLRSNKFTKFDLRILENITRIKIVDLSGNSINNKEEILNHMRAYSNIKFRFSVLY